MFLCTHTHTTPMQVLPSIPFIYQSAFNEIGASQSALKSSGGGGQRQSLCGGRRRAGIIRQEDTLMGICQGASQSMCMDRRKVCVAGYLGLLQVAVHGLGDIGGMDSVVVGILGVVVPLHHAWWEQRQNQSTLNSLTVIKAVLLESLMQIISIIRLLEVSLD